MGEATPVYSEKVNLEGLVGLTFYVYVLRFSLVHLAENCFMEIFK